MRRLCKLLTLALPAALILSLAGCGAKTPDIAANFAEQTTVECTFQASFAWTAAVDGEEYDMEQKMEGKIEADLENGVCHFLGEIKMFMDGTTEMEVYEEPETSYFRYDTLYHSDETENGFLTVVKAPLEIDLTAYEKAEGTETISGEVCDVYTGTEIDTDGGLGFASELLEGDFSGCQSDVTVRVYQNTSLPASVELVCSDVGDFSLEGTSFELSRIEIRLTYSNYGAEVEAEVPEEFKQAAADGDLELDDIFAEPSETDDGSEDDEGSHLIYNSSQSWYYEIGTPEYMTFDIEDDGYLSFICCYAENDFEMMEYQISEGYTSDDQEEYVGDLVAALEFAGYSDVTFDGIKSVEIGEKTVEYAVYYASLEDETDVYETVIIFSWIPANDSGTDWLEVTIGEYNASGDGLLIDPAEELGRAYEAVLGYYES